MNYISGLEAFFAVSEAQSFSDAARRLKISQPAVSKRIQQLEAELGLRLLQRDRKRVTLTEHGEALRRRTKPLLKAIEGAFTDIQGKSQRVEGLIRVGALIDSGPFVEWCIAFQKAYPEATIQFEFLDNFQISEAIKSGLLDFGIVSRHPDLESVQVYKIYREQTVLVTRRENQAAPSTYSSAKPMPFVRFRFRSPLRTDSASLFSPYFNRHRKALGIKAHTYQFAVNSFPSMIQVLLSTDCFAVMPLHTVSSYLQAGSLRRVSERTMDADIFLIHHHQASLDLKLKTFKDFIWKLRRREILPSKKSDSVTT